MIFSSHQIGLMKLNLEDLQAECVAWMEDVVFSKF